MSNIDPLTGLPELPEGHFWRVSHPRNYGEFYWNEEEDKSRLRVFLVRTGTEIEESKEFQGKNFFTRMLTLWLRVNKVTYEEYDRVEKFRDCKGVHPQAILNAANVIMKEWLKEQETAKLVGVYPPKRLEL